MYPRVKVRKDEDPIPVEQKATNESKCRKDSTQSQAKVSKSHPKNSLTPSISTSKGRNNKGIDGDNITNIRASSAPRPRAVLSSPDNDEMIGNQNQLVRKRETIPKRQNQNSHGQDVTRQQSQQTRRSQTPSRTQPLSQNLHARVKTGQMNARVPILLRTREVVVEDGKHTHTMKKDTSELSASLQRPSIKRK